MAQSTTRRVSLALGARGAEPALAMSLNNLSVRYGEVGRRAEGLATIEEAVAIQRRPAAASPDAYEPDLAMSLWASACVRVGLQTDLRTAFDCARESASMYRMWAERVPGMFTDKLRAVLTVAADVLAGLERDEDNEAIRRLSEEDALEEACTLLQELARPSRSALRAPVMIGRRRPGQ